MNMVERRFGHKYISAHNNSYSGLFSLEYTVLTGDIIKYLNKILISFFSF